MTDADQPKTPPRRTGLSAWIAARAAQGRALWRTVEPGSRAWSGAALGLLVATGLIIAVRIVNVIDGWGSLVTLLLGVPLGLAYALAGGLAVFVFAGLLTALPARYRLVLGSSLFLLVFEIFTGSWTERLVPTLYVIASSTVAGGAIGVFFRWRKERTSRVRMLLAIGGFACSAGAGAIGLRWLLAAGHDNAPAINAGAIHADAVPVLDLPDPSQPGRYPVRRLFYGSGTDTRRAEYGPSVALRSRPVDASPFLRGWRGFDGWARSRYWGFDPHRVPINARVFYPEGEGPFPVLMIVHGGHPMNESSEPGYDYLGEHLASWGFVFVSVDENFLNGGPWSDLGAGLGGENGARGWLLLEHLRQLRGWSEQPGTPLHGKIDMSRIALAGHSKGGEAIALAAAFNRLAHDPDDALVRFDYGFGIRALVALSVTDKQYQPAGVGTQLEDVDFLALQGSNDGDVEYWQGMQQYDRVRLTGKDYHFKAAAFVHRANHGQWNRVWATHDKTRFPRRLYFNRKPLLPRELQERVAKAYVTAFLSASLRGETRYLPFLRDQRTGRRWLPDTIYITRFEDSDRRWVSRFEEDVDVTTTTLPGGRAEGEGLTLWREQPAGAPLQWSALESRAVYLGWDASTGKSARYTVELPPGFDPEGIAPDGALVFALADAQEPSHGGRGKRPEPRRPIDLTVELVDGAGYTARLPLSHARFLQPQLDATVWKAWLTTSQQRRETVFQTFELPLADFADENPALDLHDLRAVRFVFDRTPAGLVALDDVGFAPPARP